jgi:hypothetical protein
MKRSPVDVRDGGGVALAVRTIDGVALAVRRIE